LNIVFQHKLSPLAVEYVIMFNNKNIIP